MIIFVEMSPYLVCYHKKTYDASLYPLQLLGRHEWCRGAAPGDSGWDWIGQGPLDNC